MSFEEKYLKYKKKYLKLKTLKGGSDTSVIPPSQNALGPNSPNYIPPPHVW